MAVDQEQAFPITRFELIDHNGRVYTTGINPDLEVELSYQDGGRTLKCFVTGGRGEYKDPYLEIDLLNKKLQKTCTQVLNADQRLVDIKENWDNTPFICETLEKYFGFPANKYPWYDGFKQEHIEVLNTAICALPSDKIPLLAEIQELIRREISGD